MAFLDCSGGSISQLLGSAASGDAAEVRRLEVKTHAAINGPNRRPVAIPSSLDSLPRCITSLQRHTEFGDIPVVLGNRHPYIAKAALVYDVKGCYCFARIRFALEMARGSGSVERTGQRDGFLGGYEGTMCPYEI